MLVENFWIYEKIVGFETTYSQIFPLLDQLLIFKTRFQYWYCITLLTSGYLSIGDWKRNISSVSVWSRRSTADTPTPCMWGVRPGFSFRLSHWPVAAVCSSALQEEVPRASPTAEKIMQHVLWVWISSHVCSINNIKGMLLQCLFTEVLSVRQLTRESTWRLLLDYLEVNGSYWKLGFWNGIFSFALKCIRVIELV